MTIEGVHLSCEHGMKIYLVDGTSVRDTLDSDFFSGSKRVFPFIPAGEIWIDSSMAKEEVHFIIENECVLAESLKRGTDIGRACTHAQKVETESRKLEKVAARKGWKVSTDEVCEHDLEIFVVDGTYVRDKYSSIFIQGGNEFRYGFVPKDELWVEASVPDDEKPYVIFHECYETEKMRSGWDYDRAHNAAKRAENKLRRARALG